MPGDGRATCQRHIPSPQLGIVCYKSSYKRGQIAPPICRLAKCQKGLSPSLLNKLEIFNYMFKRWHYDMERKKESLCEEDRREPQSRRIGGLSVRKAADVATGRFPNGEHCSCRHLRLISRRLTKSKGSRSCWVWWLSKGGHPLSKPFFCFFGFAVGTHG